MKRIWLIAVLFTGLTSLAAVPAPSPWNEPAAALAEQIANLLGPGQAHLTIRNLSTIPNDQIPAIRRLLEQSLKSHGVQASGTESANAIRVTLSENTRELLWVAEIVEGSQTRVTMVQLEFKGVQLQADTENLILRKERIPIQLDSLPGVLPDEPVLAELEFGSSLILIRPEEIEVFHSEEAGYLHGHPFPVGLRQPLVRDPGGLLIPEKSGFAAYLPGAECSGAYNPPAEPRSNPKDAWTIHCYPSDDPWPILTADTPTGPAIIKAFHSASRNYFTGVVTPSLGVDLPPFYSAALVPRPSGAALLVNGIDGKVQLAENGALKPVNGARDWGSEFAALRSGCGGGTQIIASGSGEALTDSLRAYELPAQEAVPASAPLTMEGTVTALWTAPDGKSVYAIVRNPRQEYEVDRVTASCN